MDPLVVLILIISSIVLITGSVIFILAMRSGKTYSQLPLLIKQGNLFFLINFIITSAAILYHLSKIISSS